MTQRCRIRDLGIPIGQLPTGEHNTLTDVPGVRVGHESVVSSGVRTGVSAIVLGDDLYRRPARGSFFSGNGHGKVVGTTQILELGTIETPILLTGTLSTFAVADALVRWVIANSEEPAWSVNPVVGETNDGGWGAPCAPYVTGEHVHRALTAAKPEPVREGCIGAGTGTRALGFKGGIGTASRRVNIAGSAATVGVLVQSNHAGLLTVEGVPIGREVVLAPGSAPDTQRPGSIMVVVGTDAPLDARQLRRVARRGVYALARTGASFAHGSGDYALSFSTVRDDDPTHVADRHLDDLFRGVLEAVDEAVLNSLTMATDAARADGTVVQALPLVRLAGLRRYGVEPAEE